MGDTVSRATVSRDISVPCPYCKESLMVVMRHYCYSWIENWCKENGWTDLFVVNRNEYWAFPPYGVMPLPIPNQTLHALKQQYGFSPDERRWCSLAVGATLIASIASYWLQCPMPLVAAFALGAVTVAQLEDE